MTPPTLIVIGGHPRSGTSSLRRILNRHPDVYCTNELPLVGVYPAFIESLRVAHERAAGADWGQAFAGRVDRLVVESWFALSKFEETRDRFERAKLIANKTPGCERYFSFYAEVLPEARFIYCFRDPVRVVKSNLNMPWSGGSIEHAMKRLRTGYTNFLSVREELGSRAHVFRIDDYAKDQQAVSRELCRFLGIRDDPDCVEPMASTPPANTLKRYESKGQSKGRELSEEETELVRSDPLVQRAMRAFSGSDVVDR